MNAEILTIGSELLTPGRIDSHSTYLTEGLTSAGIPVVFRATVGDDRELIAEAARQALARADLVVATGGLGPTSDDLTREGFADALGLGLHLDKETLARIEKRFASRGLRMPEVNRRQAMVPDGAAVLPNQRGTAPGLWISWVDSGGRAKEVILLPGPPVELSWMFETQVLPKLAGRAREVVYRTKRLLVAGLPESVVEEKIGPIAGEYENPRVTLLASPGQVEVVLTAQGRGSGEAEVAIEALASRLRGALGVDLVSESGESLELVLGRMLSERGKTLSVAESLTGGLITHRLTEIPGSSAYVERSFVTYSNRSKIALLGVPEDLIREHGAVSEAVALAMASGARQRAGTDIGLAVTGIAGPGGGGPEKPVGLVYMALSDDRGELARRFHLAGERSQVKQWAAQLALNLLRLRLIGG